jgi:hypothetical protein
MNFITIRKLRKRTLQLCCANQPPLPKHRASGHVAENHPRWFSYRSMPLQVLVLFYVKNEKKIGTRPIFFSLVQATQANLLQRALPSAAVPILHCG